MPSGDRTRRDVYVYDAVRTPFGRYAGALAGERPDDLAAVVVRAILERSPGLDPARVDEVLGSSEYADAVQADIDQARAFGATGVPFYVVDRKYGISGAQPREVFSQVLERAWDESHPKLDLVGGADACGPDGCAI